MQTKTKDYIKSMFVGIMISTLILISSIYITFKSGVNAIVDTVLLSIILLTVIRGLKTKNVALSDIFARASLSTMTTTAVYFATALLFGEQQNINETILFGIIIMISSIMGILFFSTLSENFSDQKRFKFPLLAPRIDLINSVGNDKAKNRYMVFALVIAAIYSFIVKVINFIPKQIKIAKNSMFTLDNSLILISTGYFIGYATYLKMGIGFVYSLIIYIIFRSANFSSHILNPYIYSVVLGFSLTQGGVTLYSVIKKWYPQITRSSKPTIKKISSSSILILVVLTLIYFLFFSRLLNPKYNLPFWIFLILIPITIISSTSTLIGVAETGFWFSALEDILPIIIILLTQTSSLTTIVMVITGLTAFEMSGLYYAINAQVAGRFDITHKELTTYSIISSVMGAFLCVTLVSLLAKSIEFGGQELPLPTVQVFGMTLKGMMEAVAARSIPSYLNIYVLIIACISCVLLNKIKISPMIILGGILLPFGTFFVIGIGALLSFVLRKNGNGQRTIFSGISVGDGLVSAISTICRGIQ